ncbi:MAG: transglutaminase-like domain-containing protein, partial [Oscillospiraceae bacterium]|nr:transglutaminase-like domain-containing protein [Oscillospiraceae bacterium]
NMQYRIINERALTGAEATLYGLSGRFDNYILFEFLNEAGTVTEGALQIFVSNYGLTAAEYLHYLAEYERMVYEVFTEVTPSERENVQRMLDVVRRDYSRNPGGSIYDFDNIVDAYKASIIEEYFKHNFDYSLTVDNHSGGNSYLGNFLFDTQTGHCALYATAMTLMLRELGIPARYVTGYVAGGASAERFGERYRHQILERDIHAWVEVYFEKVGWIPFDPTPPIYELVFIDAERHQGGRVTMTPRTTTATTTTTTTIATTTTTPVITTTPVFSPMTPPELTTPPDTDEPETPQAPFMREDEPRSFVFTIQMLLILLIVLLVSGIVFAVVMFLKGLKLTEQKRLAKYADLNERETAREAYRFILKLLGIEGLTACAGETPVKFADRVDEELRKNIPEASGLSPAIDAIRKLEFSKETLNAEEYACLSAATAELYRQVVTEKKALKRFVRRVIMLGVIK